MKSLNRQNYEELYAKYLNTEQIEKNLAHFEKIEGESFLDLVCQNGTTTDIVLRKNPKSIYMIDICTGIVPYYFKYLPKIKIFNNGAIDSIQGIFNYGEKIKNIFCPNINYIFEDDLFFNLSILLEEDGMFVFNAITNKPNKDITFNKYEFNKKKYMEIDYLIEEISIEIEYGKEFNSPKEYIQHIQICENMDPHITSYLYLSPETLKKELDKYFNFKIIKNENNDTYVCKKK